MKKLLIGTLAILLSTFGFQKLADTLDTAIKSKAMKAERTIASNGEIKSKGGDDKGKNKA